MTELDVLAQEVGVSGRTLRRAAARGAIRCLRPTERKIVVPASERHYVRRHWPLLATLIRALRTQPNVRLAVLFGSIARGDDRPASDLDFLIRLRDDTHAARAELVERVEEACGRRTQLVSAAEAYEAPLLLADVLRDGRVLVDRDGDWPGLVGRRRSIRRRAWSEDRRLQGEAWAVLDTLGLAR